MKTTANKLPRRIGIILFELLMVIVGVLIAFSLSNYENWKKEKQEQEKLLQLCKQELKYNLSELYYGELIYDSLLTTFTTQEQNLKQPRLEFRNISYIYDKGIWETAVAKGLFNGEIIGVISDINSEINGLALYCDRLHDFNTHLLLPNIDQPIEEFYHTDNKRLKAKYEWYPNTLGIILSRFRQLNKASRKLQELIVEIE
ncbi:MAG: hypothetical protein AAGG68_02430 [Bacteroidota bacterium]